MINKKVVIFSTLIVILVVGGIVGYKIYKINSTKYVSVQKENKDNTISNNTTINNTQKNEKVEEKKVIEQEIKEVNNIKDSTTQNTEIKGKEEIESKNENETNGKQEALELVKEEWGEDNTVYFTIDSSSGNIYMISVRSKTTTETLTEYEVDVTNKKVVMK